LSEAARLILDALEFAAHAQGTQRREDAGDSYLVHLAEVAAACGGHEPFDPVLVAAALLHDVVEDTEVTEADLRTRFGDEIADLVMEVTDPPDMPKANKQAIQAEHVSRASERARLLKIADKTSNVAELAALPAPATDEIHDYLAGARLVVNACRGTDPRMEAAFDAVASRLEERLSKRPEGSTS
jgi:guanosine-3',5'-bis(diphosphate) 3'-pyrophosphohydrolase